MKKERTIKILLGLWAGLLLLCLSACSAEPQEVRVPILMYHAFAGEDSDSAVSAQRFEEQVGALVQEGYEGVFLSDLYHYVADGRSLPEKPVVLMSDDGYLSAVTIALEICEKYGMKLNVAVIGWSFGRHTFKDGITEIMPHFGAEDLTNSVLNNLELVNHSYDMHYVERERDQWADLFREGALRRSGEKEKDYEASMTEDYRKMQILLEPWNGHAEYYVYPYGRYDRESENVLRQLGVKMTLTTQTGIALVRRNDLDSLYLLPRISMDSEVGAEELIRLLS